MSPTRHPHRPIRLALAALAALALAAAPAARAQGARPLAEPAVVREVVFHPVGLAIGERLGYDVKFGALKVGAGAMEVREVADVRGRAAWHIVFTLQGGVPFYRVNDRLESWIDTETFASLRFQQSQHEGRYRRERTIEMYPERRTYVEAGKHGGAEQPSVDLPLDDASFLYFLRTVPFEVGRSYEFDRYFRPDRNPVKLEVLRRERVTVPAGTFDALVVRPVIKTPGIFSEKGQAEVWLTDDARRLVVQMKAKLPFGSISLYLREYAEGRAP